MSHVESISGINLLYQLECKYWHHYESLPFVGQCSRSLVVQKPAVSYVHRIVRTNHKVKTEHPRN